MEVHFKFNRNTPKEFKFKEGDDVKVIETSFLYADEKNPETVFTGKITEIDEDGFWLLKENETQDEHFPFSEVEEVIGINDEYPNRKDPLIRFALDGPWWE